MEVKQPLAWPPLSKNISFERRTQPLSTQAMARQYERQPNLSSEYAPLLPPSLPPSPILNPDQISGWRGEEIVVHFLTN